MLPYSSTRISGFLGPGKEVSAAALCSVPTSLTLKDDLLKESAMGMSIIPDRAYITAARILGLQGLKFMHTFSKEWSDGMLSQRKSLPCLSAN